MQMRCALTRPPASSIVAAAFFWAANCPGLPGAGEMRKKVSTAWRVLGARGLTGFIDLLAVSGRRILRRRWARYLSRLGTLVRLRGNRVQIGGCTFDVGHPLISNAIRSRLARGRYERPELAII